MGQPNGPGLADEAVSVPKRGDAAPDPEMQQQFDLAAYGYTGPVKAEAPKPGPPSAQQPESVTLTFNVGSSVDETLLATLRQAVRARVSAEPEPVTEPEAPVVPEPVAETVPTDTAESAWAQAVANLTKPKPNPWAQAMKNLTASSSATES